MAKEKKPVHRIQMTDKGKRLTTGCLIFYPDL